MYECNENFRGAIYIDLNHPCFFIVEDEFYHTVIMSGCFILEVYVVTFICKIVVLFHFKVCQNENRV